MRSLSEIKPECLLLLLWRRFCYLLDSYLFRHLPMCPNQLMSPSMFTISEAFCHVAGRNLVRSAINVFKKILLLACFFRIM